MTKNPVFRQDGQSVKKGLDAVNTLYWGCAAYPNVRKQSQDKGVAVYQPLSTAAAPFLKEKERTYHSLILLRIISSSFFVRPMEIK